MFGRSKSVLAAILLSAGLMIAPCPAKAQFGELDMVRQLHEAESVMKEYSKTHDHFPNCDAEFDDCLKTLRKKINNAASDSTATIQNNGKYRTFYQFSACIDYSDVPIVNGVPKPGDFIVAPPNSIVINTNGSDMCWGWLAGLDGKPTIVDGSPVFFEVQKPTH